MTKSIFTFFYWLSRLVVCALLCSAALAGAAQDVELSPAERAHLAQISPLKVCIDPDYMPFERNENGRHVGIAAEFLADYARWLNTELTLIETQSWQQSVAQYEQGHCDLVSMLNQTEEREQFLHFTSPYLSLDLFIIARTDAGFVAGLGALSGKTLAVVPGYRFEALIRDLYPDIQLVLVASLDEALTHVASGEVFATVEGLRSSLSGIQRLQLDNIGVAGQTIYSDEYRVGVRRDDALLLSALEKAVQAQPKLRAQEIIERGFRLPVSHSRSNALLWPGLLALALTVILAFAVLMRHYRRQLAQKNTELATLRERDPLTGLCSRRQMQEHIGQACTAVPRAQETFCLLLLDLDRFKTINARFGHAYGDQVLIEISRLLQSHVRRNDIVARWGGEEFIVLCPRTSREQGLALAEKICAQIAAHEFSASIPITVSIGLAHYQRHETPTCLLKRAHAALNQAQHSGGNRASWQTQTLAEPDIIGVDV